MEVYRDEQRTVRAVLERHACLGWHRSPPTSPPTAMSSLMLGELVHIDVKKLGRI